MPCASAQDVWDHALTTLPGQNSSILGTYLVRIPCFLFHTWLKSRSQTLKRKDGHPSSESLSVGKPRATCKAGPFKPSISLSHPIPQWPSLPEIVLVQGLLHGLADSDSELVLCQLRDPSRKAWDARFALRSQNLLLTRSKVMPLKAFQHRHGFSAPANIQKRFGLS